MEYTIERSKIQLIYDACNAVFSQKELPSYQQIQWLRNLLGIACCAEFVGHMFGFRSLALL